MKITEMKANHMTSPLGFDLRNPTFTFQVEESTGSFLKAAQIRVSDTPDMSHVLYDSGLRADISGLGFTPGLALEGGKRYYWTVTAQADDGDSATSALAWFEGGRKEQVWDLPWITSPFQEGSHPVFYSSFDLSCPLEEIASARLYLVGLGLYEAYLNGGKVGEEVLAPFYNDYRYWIQYQTYDAADLLRSGSNTLAVMLGNGWYKGRFCYLNDAQEESIYGDQFLLSAELVVTTKDGQIQRIRTGEDWSCFQGPVQSSNIYDGEVYDAAVSVWNGSELSAEAVQKAVPAFPADPPQGEIVERMSPPLCIHERFQPKLIRTPAGEQVLDFGQELTGWVEFDCAAPKGVQVFLQYGEILQDGCFYRENLRTARAEFTHYSGGKVEHVRPHFTFYGFRYVKVSGIELTEQNLASYRFEACAIYSSLQRTGTIETSDPKLNRLLENTLWGQKGNFLDIPTDCPQRDERLGWTGDAQVFCATACYHMDTAGFYRKYLRDMLYEQRENLGAVPYVVPDVLSVVRRSLGQPDPVFTDSSWGEAGSCAWGDAATIIPWTLYQFYGDRVLLSEQYENMKRWVDFIIYMDETHCDGKRLWTVGFHFADWLALDNSDPESRFGRTDPYYVASVYYLYSSELTAKAAKLLGKEADAAYYAKIADEVRAAIRAEYLTATGRLAIDTQTALVLGLYFDVIPEPFRERAARELHRKLEERGMHLDTGFVGTAYLCKALTKAGLTKDAYDLLFQEDYPGWLYEVNMGATTIWERWNSVLPNGKISGTGMNSLNHYAYGAVAEWVYRTVCGIAPDESGAGFKKALLAPVPDRRLEHVSCEYRSASGIYRIGWAYKGDNVRFEVKVPFDCSARFVTPQGFRLVSVNGAPASDTNGMDLHKGNYVLVAAPAE